eukprot:scaffold42155_cov19-Prasinocladus_malaysianus.AAC.1
MANYRATKRACEMRTSLMVEIPFWKAKLAVPRMTSSRAAWLARRSALAISKNSEAESARSPPGQQDGGSALQPEANSPANML